MMQLLIELIEENSMVTKANFSNLEIDQALVEFLENADLEMVEFQSDKNPGVVYKVATPDITALIDDNA